jgi:hypothetical protein
MAVCVAVCVSLCMYMCVFVCNVCVCTPSSLRCCVLAVCAHAAYAAVLYVFVYVCMCAFIYVRMCAYVCVYVCVL